MQKIKTHTNEKNIFLAFEIGIILKGIHAVVEIAGGIIIFFISPGIVQSIVRAITQEELMEDPKDIVSQYLIHSAQYFTVSTQHFASVYLLVHGIINLILVESLLKKRYWAYPIGITIFVLFGVYQIYRYTYTHSVWLIFFALLDIIVIGLTWHEYKHRKDLVHSLF